MSALEQIRWERDIAIQALESHGVPFGCLQRPMTFEEFSNPTLYTAAWIERIDSGVAPVIRFYIFDTPYMGITATCEPMPLNRYCLENYGKTWRCWLLRPTDEERLKAKWEE